MPRILEALQHTHARNQAAATIAERTPASNRDGAVVEAATEIPFIEVGNGHMEASADVLNAVAQRAPNGHPEPGGAVRLALHQPVAETPAICFRGVAAPAGLASELIVHHQPEHPVSEQYRALVPHICQEGEPPQVLLLCGATTVVLNLAIAVARQGRRVVVVETELQHPVVAAHLGLPSNPGLFEVLLGSTDLTRAVQKTAVPNLYALPAGECGSRCGWAVRSFRSVLKQLRNRFNFVVVAAPAWTGGNSHTAIANACDGVLLVLTHDEASTEATDKLLKELPRRGVRLRGCIVA